MFYDEVTNVARNRLTRTPEEKSSGVGSASVSHMSSQYRCGTLASGSSPPLPILSARRIPGAS